MAEHETPGRDNFNKADQKAAEAADIEQWGRQFKGDAGADDAQAQAAEDEAIARGMEQELRAASAVEQQQASEASARDKIGHIDMERQQQALEAHEREVPPQEVVADQMIAALNQVAADGVAGERRLSNLDDPHNPIYRDAIPLMFEKLGFEDPMPVLEAERKNWRGKPKPGDTVIRRAYAQGDQQINVSAYRHWDKVLKQPAYVVTGGVAEYKTIDKK